MGGASCGGTSARTIGSSPCISSEALPMQPALTNVRRSMSRFPIQSRQHPGSKPKSRSDYDSPIFFTTTAGLTLAGMVTISFAMDTLSLQQNKRKLYAQLDQDVARNHCGHCNCNCRRIACRDFCPDDALRPAVEERPCD